MRRAGVLFAACVSLALPQVTRGDELVLGFLSFDNLIADAPGQIGVSAFDVTNLTGDPSGIPTSTAVTLTNSTLALDGGPAIALGDIGPQSFFSNSPSVLFPDSQNFASAEFKATLDQTSFLLPDGVTTFTANSTAIDVLLLPSSGNSLAAGIIGGPAGDTALIEVSNTPATVPEPGDWLLLGTIAVWIFRKARRAARPA